MTMSTVLASVGKLLLALASGGIGYYLGRRSKIDDLRLAEVHRLVREISVTLQNLHTGTQTLARWFRSNFAAMPSVADGVGRFRQHADGMYAAEKVAIEKLDNDRAGLGELLKQSRVYLPEELCGDVAAYLETCSFAYSQVWLFFDTYLESLFENLLDEEKALQRTRLQKRIMKGLRKAAS